MEPVLVLIPHHAPADLDWPGVELHRYTSPLDIPGILANCPLPALLFRDDLEAAHAGRVADAIRAHPAPVIIVSARPWDGETPDPVAAVCRGVVAGFGYRAIDRVLEILRG